MKPQLRAFRCLLHLLFLPLLSPATLYGQGFEGGRQYYRLRYDKASWQVLHMPSFHLYFQKGGDSLCAFVARELPAAMRLIKERMGSESAAIPNIIIYPSADKQYQSNIGSAAVPVTGFTLPTFVSKGTRILLAFNGSYEALRLQIYSGLARAYWEGGMATDLAAQAKGISYAATNDFWFKEGAIAAFAEGWPLTREEELRKVFYNALPATFGDLVNSAPTLGGQAFCHYLNVRFRKDAGKQVFFQLRRRKPLNTALRLVTKRDAATLFDSCFLFYRSRFSTGIEERLKDTSNYLEKRLLLRLPKGKITAVVSNPAGDAYAVIMRQGYRRIVYCLDTPKRRCTRLTSYELPPWLPLAGDAVYPLLSWDDEGQTLVVTMPAKGGLLTSRFNQSGKRLESVKLPLIDGVSSLLPQSERAFLLAAWYRGQSDLVAYDGNKDRFGPITNDTWDDAAPVDARSKGSSSVYFLSGRPANVPGGDTMPLRRGIYSTDGNTVAPIATDTLPYAYWTRLSAASGRNLIAVTSRSGQERAALIYPAGGSMRTELLGPSIPAEQYQAKADRMLNWKLQGDSLLLLSRPFASWLRRERGSADSVAAQSAWLQDYNRDAEDKRREDSLLKKAKADGGENGFLTGVLSHKPDTKKGKEGRDHSGDMSAGYDFKNVKPYVLQLYSAYFSAKVNNDYFANRYQPYQGTQGTYKIPDVGGMVQGGLSDLFEDHHLNIAYRLPAGSEGSSFAIRYRNTKRRLEYGLAYLRDVSQIKPDPLRDWRDENGRPYPGLAKLKTHYYELSLQYPLSYYAAVGGSLAVRKDRTAFEATEKYSLTFPPIQSVWALASIYYNIAKLRPTLPGLYRGWRFRAGIDAFAGFTQKNGVVGVCALEAAWHKPIYKYITLVLQGHAGASGGGQYILYNLGGVDNNLTQRVDSTVHFSQAAPYAFQRLITPFRGFLQNSIYGNRYALFNADIYFPLFASLIPIQTNFSAINNLQIGLFSDMAGAAETFTAATQKGKWLSSFGYSARTTLAGYPLRFDMGWPGSFTKRPVYYLSLSLM